MKVDVSAALVTMKCWPCDTPVVLLQLSGVCPLADPTDCPLAAKPRRWTRTEVGDDAYCDLTDTIDPGDDDR